MNRYKDIEEELVNLGWSVKNGSGDHVLFDKPGNRRPIPVPVKLNEGSKSYQNTIAHIRQVEPNFTLGRPTPKKTTEDNLSEEPVPDGTPDWMLPGSYVRWSKPEQFDYGKLYDDGSVMNRRYKVEKIKDDGNGLTADIFDEDNKVIFTVPSAELDRWETETCSKCNKPFPLNRLVDHDKGYLCKDCLRLLVREKRKDEQQKEKLILETAKNAASTRISPELQQLSEKYRNIPIGDLPDEQKRQMAEEFKAILDTLPAKVKKLFAKQNAETMQVIDRYGGKKSVTPYQAWKAYLDKLIEETSMLDRDTYARKSEFNKLKTEYFATSYKLSKLRNGSDTVNVIEITTKSWDILMNIWEHSAGLFDEFSGCFPEGDVCAILASAKDNVRQYVVNTYDGSGLGTLRKLSEILKDTDAEALSRARMDTSIPNIREALGSLGRWTGEILKGNDEGVHSCILLALRPQDEEDFENAIPYLNIDLMMDDSERGRDALDAILGKLKKKEGLDLNAPHAISVTLLSEKNKKGLAENRVCFFGDHYKEYDNATGEKSKADKETFGLEPGDTILKISVLTKEDISVDCTTTDESNRNEYRKILTGAFGRLTEKGGPEAEAILFTAKKIHDRMGDNPKTRQIWNELFNDTKQIINKNAMNETNYLEMNNPDSKNEAAGALTTRELLLELKARGFAWDNLRKTVVVTVDDSEI